MMKFRKMMFAGLALTMLTACSQDDDLTGNGANGAGEGDAYMALSIAMPNNGMGGRAISNNTGDNGSQQAGTDAGTDAEQKVSTLTVYVWQEVQQLNGSKVWANVYKHTYQDSDLKPESAAPGADNASVYTTPSFVVSKGVSKVVAVVNGGEHFTDKNDQTIEKMREVMAFELNNVAGISQNGTFLMTNAFDIRCQDQNGNDLTDYDEEDKKEGGNKNKFNLDGTVHVNVQGTKQNPTTVIIPVERAVAKLQEATTNANLMKKVENTEKDEVVFQSVALVNGNKKFFPIKKVRANGQNDYIVDPNFKDNMKKPIRGGYDTDEAYQQALAGFETWLSENFYSYKAKDLNFVELGEKKDDRTPESDIFYTLENTMIANQQMNAYTTGLYYKAQYKLNGEQGDVYRFKGSLYNFEKLKADKDCPKEIAGFVGESSNLSKEVCQKYGITKYSDGICYYPYWIRHVPSADDLAPMEFGVVRNNWYQMTLGKVHGIGTPDPVDPNPETPDETAEAQLEVVVKVLPWTVRKNNVDF